MERKIRFRELLVELWDDGLVRYGKDVDENGCRKSITWNEKTAGYGSALKFRIR